MVENRNNQPQNHPRAMMEDFIAESAQQKAQIKSYVGKEQSEEAIRLCELRVD